MNLMSQKNNQNEPLQLRKSNEPNKIDPFELMACSVLVQMKKHVLNLRKCAGSSEKKENKRTIKKPIRKKVKVNSERN